MEKKKLGTALAVVLAPAVALHGVVKDRDAVKAVHDNMGDLPAAAITDTGLIYVTTSTSSVYYVVNTILGDLIRKPQPMDVRPVPTDVVKGSTSELPQNVQKLRAEFPVVFSTTKKST